MKVERAKTASYYSARFPWHPGVVCNGCMDEIRGMRYKCLECKDYDLCCHCESDGRHSDHDMIRFISPLIIKAKSSKLNEDEAKRNERRRHILLAVDLYPELEAEAEEEESTDRYGEDLRDDDNDPLEPLLNGSSVSDEVSGEESFVMASQTDDLNPEEQLLTPSEIKSEIVLIADSNTENLVERERLWLRTRSSPVKSDVKRPPGRPRKVVEGEVSEVKRPRGRPKLRKTVEVKNTPGRPRKEFSMDRNIIKDPSVQLSVLCHLCKKRFASTNDMKKHLMTHYDAESLAAVLHPHKSTNNTLIEEFHVCTLCMNSYKTPRRLREHQRMRHGPKLLACEYCGKRFAMRTDLIKHVRIHTGEKPYKCDLCDKAFKLKCQVNSHRRTHSDEKPFACDKCNKKYRKNEDLKLHSRVHTGASKPFLCNFCGKGFLSCKSLCHHMEKLHHLVELKDNEVTIEGLEFKDLVIPTVSLAAGISRVPLTVSDVRTVTVRDIPITVSDITTVTVS